MINFSSVESLELKMKVLRGDENISFGVVVWRDRGGAGLTDLQSLDSTPPTQSPPLFRRLVSAAPLLISLWNFHLRK